jgi:hypothetical protein
MGIFQIPASTSGIKLVQRGQAVSSGNITITAVDTTKTFVRSFSEGAAGTVAMSGSSTGTLSPISGTDLGGSGASGTANSFVDSGTFPNYSGTRTLSGGTMNATIKHMGVYLSDSTTLVASGACRWEVVEFA